MRYIGKMLLLLFVLDSCSENIDKNHKNRQDQKQNSFFNTYKVFDEPGATIATNLHFYLLIVSFNSFGSTRIISIRQDSNVVYGDYKMASIEEVPSIQFVTDFDSTSFSYSTIHFKTSNNEMDTIRRWALSLNIPLLKDSANSNHLDGGMREIIFYDGVKTYHIYRAFGSDRELEPDLKLFIDKVETKYCSAFSKRY